MANPDFENRVDNARWPVTANNDGKHYFIFQIVDKDGYANQVFYRDMSLHGTDDLIETVAKAWLQKRKLRIYLTDKTNMLVGRVELGPQA